MKQVKVQINTGDFVGSVQLKIKKFKERLKLVKEFANVKDGDEKSVLRMLELCEENVVSLEIKNGDDKITDLEELGYYADGTLVIVEIAKNIIGGIQPKKNISAS